MPESGVLHFLLPQQRNMSIIAFQSEFRPAFSCVYGSNDCREFRAGLVEMDHIAHKPSADQTIEKKRPKTGQIVIRTNYPFVVST